MSPCFGGNKNTTKGQERGCRYVIYRSDCLRLTKVARWHGNPDHALLNMVATHYGLVLFFSDYPKAIHHGEIALKSNHLVKFRFDNNTGQFLGVVQANQRNKNYKVEVDIKHFFVLFCDVHLPVFSYAWMSSEFCYHFRFGKLLFRLRIHSPTR